MFCTVLYMVSHSLLNVLAIPALIGKVSFETVWYSVVSIGYSPIVTTDVTFSSVFAANIKYPWDGTHFVSNNF